MTLDIPTLMVMQSFAMACAGSLLLFAWVQNRTTAALAVWGLANLMAASGIIALMLGVALSLAPLSALGGALLSFQSGLMWKVARMADGKRAPLALAALGPLTVVIAGANPTLRALIGTIALTIGATYIFLAAFSLWLGRAERIRARWPLLGLTILHGFALLVGSYSTFRGTTAQHAVPALASLFGFIYFESIVFTVGTSVFLLAVVKERNEEAGRKAAFIDPLTGIDNRAGFLRKAERMMLRCRRENAPVSVMMFDLDRFKLINDTYGHAAGDAVIRRFCETATAVLRVNDVFGRLGGEEFAIVLPRSGIEAAHVRADRIRSAFAVNCQVVGEHNVDATVSCGLSTSPTAETSLTGLLEEADAALYRAKAAGRNRVKRADDPKRDPDMHAVIRVA